MNDLEAFKQFTGLITLLDIVLLAGLISFIVWLVRTSCGKKALLNSSPRQNNMPICLPFIPLFIWLGGVSTVSTLARILLKDLSQWQEALTDTLILCVGAIVGIVVILLLAKIYFVRQLKGFGLNVKTIGKDFAVGFVNLLSIWPVVMLVLLMTIFLGGLIVGSDFKIEQHQEIKSIMAFPQISVRVIIIITTILIVPVFEEMLFRGLIQTMIRSRLRSPWLSILITSGLFTVVHANAAHWPAIFVLAMCFGYSYEKNGSLFRPIFIHSLFNAVSIIAALYSVS